MARIALCVSQLMLGLATSSGHTILPRYIASVQLAPARSKTFRTCSYVYCMVTRLVCGACIAGGASYQATSTSTIPSIATASLPHISPSKPNIVCQTPAIR